MERIIHIKWLHYFWDLSWGVAKGTRMTRDEGCKRRETRWTMDEKQETRKERTMDKAKNVWWRDKATEGWGDLEGKKDTEETGERRVLKGEFRILSGFRFFLRVVWFQEIHFRELSNVCPTKHRKIWRRRESPDGLPGSHFSIQPYLFQISRIGW